MTLFHAHDHHHNNNNNNIILHPQRHRPPTFNAMSRQPDLGPGTAVFKEESASGPTDSHRPHHLSQQGPSHQQQHHQQHLHHPRPPSSSLQQAPHPQSPRQPPPLHSSHPHAQPGPYPSPHSAHPLNSHHPSPYAHAGHGQAPAGHHPPDLPYFGAHPSPYSASSASGNYSSAENPELSMAAAHLSRPYPPIFHTPQSNSPASVSSSSGHDQHGRSMYPQPSPQIPQAMYGYPQSYPPMPPAGPSYGHPPLPPHSSSLTSQPLLMGHQPGPTPLQHQATHPHVQSPMAASPRQKVANTPLQRPTSVPVAAASHPSGGPAGSGVGPAPQSAAPGGGGNGPGAAGVNPNAAPGPIPATTPLVVKQDGNGVQWIAFEYSRDRVKMEYTIRCDVESVNQDALSPEFKTENCVYPRACCAPQQYRGNRLNYETECNTVGWALAELNPPLRGKRGLIQRAVDSWRNSNQDPRLRSRRVRRMAKMNNRKAPAVQHPNHMAPPSGPVSSGVAGAGGMKLNVPMGTPQLHHHHAHPDGSAQGGADDVGGGFNDSHQHHHHQPPNGSTGTSPNDLRHRQIFHPYPSSYSTDQGVTVTTIPPSGYDAMDPMGGHPSNANAVATSASKGTERNVELFGALPEAKRRKFILVDDPARGARVRVRVMLDQVETKEIPDSYRKTNSVFPRSYFPMQMQSPSTTSGDGRFADDDSHDEDGDASGRPGRGRTLVPVPMLDGSEREVPMPRISRAKRRKEVTLNDMGYRMSWTQSRVFAGRTIFLQRALDAYRNKVTTTMTGDGQDVTAVAPHFETRVGKRKWLERTRHPKRATTP